MSILVKGLEMPKCCDYCRLNGKGDICMLTFSDTRNVEGRLANCPLEEYGQSPRT